MTRMNHELRNRQQRARESLRAEIEEMHKQARLDRAAWKAKQRTRDNRGTYNGKRRSRRQPQKVRTSRPPKTMKFAGALRELKRLLRPLKLAGIWSNGLNGVWTLRCLDGSLLNWAESTGSLWCQGPEAARSKLERRVRKRLRNWLREAEKS